MLVASALASAVALAASAVASGVDAPAGLVYVLAGLFTIASSPYVPAEGALLPAVSRTPQELAAANVAHSAMDKAASWRARLSPAVAGRRIPRGRVRALRGGRGGGDRNPCWVAPDRRPEHVETDFAGIAAETARGGRILLSDDSLRLIGATLIALVFFEGAADVLVVILAFDELGLGQGSVGWLNAAWGIGALVGPEASL